MQSLVISGKLAIPQDRIYYQPGPWEVLKHGWIQYLSYFVLVFVLGYVFMAFLFSSQILTSHEITYSPVPESALKSLVY
jgi:hypothetical protein